MNEASRTDDTRPTALVTGLRGFTGRYVGHELEAAGYRVIGTAHGGEMRGNDLHAIDLLDRDAVGELVSIAQPDVVVHLAGIAFVAHGDADSMYRVNVVGTRNLLEALSRCRKAPRSVLLASSANVYGNAPTEQIDEDMPVSPQNDYAVSKVAMEHMARLWLDKLPVAIARPFNYTGVGQGENFVVPKIVAHFRARASQIELGRLDVAREFSDVRMVASIYRRLVDAGTAGETFNICSGAAYTLAEVLSIMATIAGYEIDVRVNLTLVRSNEVRRLVGSNAKLAAAIGGVEPIPLRRTLEWMYTGSDKSADAGAGTSHTR